MPYFLLRHNWGGGYEISLPGLHPWPIVPDKQDGWQTIVEKTTIYRPIQGTSMPALHTIVTCDLAKAQFSYDATLSLFEKKIESKETLPRVEPDVFVTGVELVEIDIIRF